ncbi:hypothetical protein [Desulfobaculum bizertense]|uniref:Uncharacterized protein n=1 Tax=Desulfobaculum bizertense DSM 18034 TaxID=1121442 RepID=A0A1T4W1E6_9BACT|nr:hypothetical protein [Desulfobaculum bizertense]SKA70885.1 hypothetical protein SAMN02745702_01359 [Desulfobaculum bizertense DSM 18034]
MPSKKNRNKFSPLLSILASVIPHKAIYISTPITSGKRLIKYLQHFEKDGISNDNYLHFLKHEVIEPNCRAGREFAQKVRSKTSLPAIEPTCFFQKEWTQKDYLLFWELVIQHYAQEVWFNEGWQFSNGCTYEFYIALREQLPAKDHSGKIISRKKASMLLSESIEELKRHNRDPTPIQKIFNQIRHDSTLL